MRNGKTKSSSTTSAELWSKNGGIPLAKSVLPICSWDWQISEPAFYEAIAPSAGCTDGFASRVREFANSIGNFLSKCQDVVRPIGHSTIDPYQGRRANHRLRHPLPIRRLLGYARF